MESRSPRHKWSEDDRIVLALLHVLYDMSEGEKRQIFNHIFHLPLLEEGFSDGMPANSIQAQVYDMQHGCRGAHHLALIQKSTLPHIRERYNLQKETIEDASQALGIQLRMRLLLDDQADPLPMSSRSYRRAHSVSTDTPVTSYEGSLCSDESLISEMRLDRIQGTTLQTVQVQYTSIERYPAKLRVEKQESRTGFHHPVLLFRTFQRTHGMRSRKFQGSPNQLPNPPTLQSPTFRQLVVPHLKRRIYRSPFISLAQSPRNALHPKRLQLDNDLAFAIFQYEKVYEDAAGRYDSEDCGPWATPVVCATHSIFDLPRTAADFDTPYTGRGEFLCWGAIECEPIAVLSAYEAYYLRSIVQTIKDLDYTSGLRFGKCITRIPDFWKELVAYKFIRTYMPKRKRNCLGSKAYHQYMQGVYDAGREDRSVSASFDQPDAHTAQSKDCRIPKVTESSWGTTDEDDDLIQPVRRRKISAVEGSRENPISVSSPTRPLTNKNTFPDFQKQLKTYRYSGPMTRPNIIPSIEPIPHIAAALASTTPKRRRTSYTQYISSASTSTDAAHAPNPMQDMQFDSPQQVASPSWAPPGTSSPITPPSSDPPKPKLFIPKSRLPAFTYHDSEAEESESDSDSDTSVSEEIISPTLLRARRIKAQQTQSVQPFRNRIVDLLNDTANPM